MFDLDDHLRSATRIGFEYRRFDDEGRIEAEVSNYLRNDQAEYLPHILDAFKQFLNGMGYTYVEEIYAVKANGEETSSAEVIF